MKVTCRALALALLFAPAASYATKVPIPIEGATLNVSFQVQPEFLIQEAGTPTGDNPSYDIFARRTRLLINGDLGPNFTYLVQVDNANFGKYGNFATPRAIVQDAWVGWAPTGITGGTVIYIDAGILLIPISHHLLESTTNFITADVQTDAFRYPGNPYQGLRDTGVQIRGWALDKKIGFRGGVYEGYTPFDAACAPATPGSCIAPKRNPAFGGLINIDLIGSEEGAWLYGAYKWGKDPILSIGGAINYQSQVLRNIAGSLADQRLFAGDVYLNLPAGDTELVAEGTVYYNGNGTGSGNTGLGLSGSVGYRLGPIAPYAAFDYFQSSDSCSDLLTSGVITNAQLTSCNSGAGSITGVVGGAAVPDSANSRNYKFGLNYFIAKNTNHINVEFQVNHGQSSFGPSSFSTGNAGYVPLALDPAVPNGPRRAFNNNLRNPAFKSLLVHWNFIF